MTPEQADKVAKPRYTVVRNAFWDYSPSPWKVVDTQTGQIVSHEEIENVAIRLALRWSVDGIEGWLLYDPHGERIVRETSNKTRDQH